MPTPRITLATRDWDHLMPLLTGVIRPAAVELNLQARSETPVVLDEPDLDGGETSFSRYALGRLAGDDRLVAVPVFLMRGFRHRCILVRSESDLDDPSQLAGCRVGLTGWPDSGNTWTRAVIRAAGVDLAGINWQVGPLADEQFDPRRLGAGPLPANVHPVRPGASLTSELRAGALDAILTPFMPPGFFDGTSGVRHLFADHRSVERDFYLGAGYVPGIHLLALRREVVERHPWLPASITDLFERSKLWWVKRRQLLADTTPWLLADLEDSASLFDGDWMPYGLAENQTMISDFGRELHAQGITDRVFDLADLFPAQQSMAFTTGGSQ